MSEMFPAELTAGDTWSWSLAFAAASPSAGWSCAVKLAGLGGAREIAGTAAAGGWRFDLAAADSAGVAPGSYQWFAVATRAAERATLGTGRLVVRVDPAQLPAGYDPAGYWEKLRDACRAAIANKAAADQLELSFAGRELRRYPMRDLVELEREAVRQIERERNAEAAARGVKRSPSVILTRF